MNRPYSFCWLPARIVTALALCLLLGLGACSPRQMIIDGVADELAGQAQGAEEDLELAREASAFYLKLSESLLQSSPGNAKLAEAVTGGFVQYAYAFVAIEADRLESREAKAAQALRTRAARLYGRAQRHGMAALALRYPGLRETLKYDAAARTLALRGEEIGLAYWTAAAWGGAIALSKHDPEAVADLPLAVRLATRAWQTDPDWGEGALASLMGSFEAGRPGGDARQAQAYFDRAIVLSGERVAGPYVGKAEHIALAAGDRAQFTALLQQALRIATAHRNLQNEVMQARARWLIDHADELF